MKIQGSSQEKTVKATTDIELLKGQKHKNGLDCNIGLFTNHCKFFVENYTIQRAQKL